MTQHAQYISHFIELRRRIVHCALCYLLILAPLIFFSGELYTFVATPILQHLPSGSMLVATDVITPFTTPLKLALFLSFIILVPMLLYHAWAFVSPALYSHEKQAIRPVLLVSILLFYLGIAFAHCLVLPMALGFFIHVAPKGVTVMTDIQSYLDFVFVIYFAFGAAFQVPVVTYVFIQTGITTIENLEKHRAIIIVAAFVVGMLLTPPDVVSQILLAVPLLGLFESGLLLSKFQRYWRSKSMLVSNRKSS